MSRPQSHKKLLQKFCTSTSLQFVFFLVLCRWKVICNNILKAVNFRFDVDEIVNHNWYHLYNLFYKSQSGLSWSPTNAFHHPLPESIKHLCSVDIQWILYKVNLSVGITPTLSHSPLRLKMAIPFNSVILLQPRSVSEELELWDVISWYVDKTEQCFRSFLRFNCSRRDAFCGVSEMRIVAHVCACKRV